MIRSILVPMDGSKAANSALEDALDLAQIAGAQLRGLFVEDESELFPLAFPPPAPDMGMGAVETSVLPPALSQYVIKEWERTGEQTRRVGHKRKQGTFWRLTAWMYPLS
jgi:nucleotide-binding universal stress UspA family protein